MLFRSEIEQEIENEGCEEEVSLLQIELHQLVDIFDNLKGRSGDEQWRGDWYPVTLVRDSHFVVYAQDLAEECGMIDRNVKWPHTCIDWKHAARELQYDYTSTSIGGVDYWYR